MLLKTADDRDKDVQALKALLGAPGATEQQKAMIERELRMLRSGVSGEEDAAYLLGFRLNNSQNWLLIHDLRLEVDGKVAQIDHLVMNRFLEIWVCESKRFGEGVRVNDHGEFEAFYRGRPYGIPSPIEQNERHIAVMKALIQQGVIVLPRRMGVTIQPVIRSAILVSTNARIQRSGAARDNLDQVMKVDQFVSRLFKEDSSVLSLAKVVSQETLLEQGQQWVAQHRPIQVDWAAKFGLSPSPVSAARISGDKHANCERCGDSVGKDVVWFCRMNKPRFGGKIYCRTCQSQYGR